MLTRARDHWLRSKRLGRQRIQRRLVHCRELRCSRAFAFAERPLVDAVAQLADGLVQFLDREELSIAQRRDDPTLGQLAHPIRPWPCRAACMAAPEPRRRRNAWPSPDRSDSDRDRSGRLSSRRSWCCRAPPVSARPDRTRKPARERRSSLPTARRQWLRRRCRNWLPARRRIDAPAAPDHHADRRSGSLFRPNRRTASRRPCAPGAAPHPACAASAGTARRNGSSDSRPGWPAGTPPTATAGSRVDVAAAADEDRRSRASATRPGERRGGPPNSAASSRSSSQSSPSGHVTPAASARCRYSCAVPRPIEQLRAIARSPRPTSNFNRRTSLILRTDYVPGNIIRVMCPPALCDHGTTWLLIQGARVVFGNIKLQRLQPFQ